MHIHFASQEYTQASAYSHDWEWFQLHDLLLFEIMVHVKRKDNLDPKTNNVHDSN